MWLSVYQGPNNGSYFNDADLVRTIMDLHGGGTETTSNTLLTAFLYLMTKPGIQGLTYEMSIALHLIC